jgi:catechol 2,3-dioxygenase-like lactoylglutathione lyase family enzyme
MTLNHIHLRIRDLKAAVDWFGTILQVQPDFRNERMAALPFGSFTVILDVGDADVPATLGFQSDDCDRDFYRVIDQGAEAIEPPANKEWGIRTAYFKGPGALKCEIEGPVANR